MKLVVIWSLLKIVENCKIVETGGDIQVIFDASRGAAGNVGCRVRQHGEKQWGRIAWLTNPVVKPNPEYTTLRGAQPVYLGKYAAASTVASDFSVGEVTLVVPKAP